MKKAKPEARLQLVAMDMILEPEIAMRAQMDDAKMLDLKQSMAELGLLSPILVCARDGAFEVVDGHRRLLAARSLGWAMMPTLVFEGEGQAKEAAKLHSNEIREAVNAADEALFIAELIEKYKLDEEGICKMVHRSPDYVADRLRLLRGDKKVFASLQRGDISFAVARELNKFDDDQMRAFYLDAALRAGCSSRVVAGWLADYKVSRAVLPPPGAAVSEQPPPPAIESFHPHCEICGGDKDPYNLVTIQVHTWELAMLRKAIDGVADPTRAEAEKP